MSAPLLTVTGLRAGYGDADVLHGIDLHVGAGEYVCVIGPNTAGKSTILRAISGVIPRAVGSILFAGIDLMRLKAHEVPALGIAHVPEGRQVFPQMTRGGEPPSRRVHEAGRAGSPAAPYPGP